MIGLLWITTKITIILLPNMILLPNKVRYIHPYPSLDVIFGKDI